MKVVPRCTLILTAIFLLGTALPAHAQSQPVTTVTCANTCSPSFSNYVGTVSLSLTCNPQSPASYTGTLTVNGVSVSETQTCTPPTAPCSAVGVNSWGAGCSETINYPSIPSGTTVTNTNTAPGYSGSVQWTCNNGAWVGPTNISCTANPVAGICGSANGYTYPNGSTSYSPYTQCSSGSSSNSAFPSAGGTTYWTCSGTNGGPASPTCSASQAAPATPTVTISQSASQTTSNGSQALGGQGFTVSWAVSGSATSCTVNHQTPDGAWTNGWGSSGGTGGSQSASPGWVGTHQWSVSCTGPGGTSNTASLSHAVVCPSGTAWNGSSCITPPTASLLIDGMSSETLTPGQSNTKTWSSTGGTSWSSSYTMSGTCTNQGSGGWVANTASGSVTNTANSANSGCTAIITYTVSNAAGTAQSSISVTTAAQSTPTGSLNVSPVSCTIASGASTCTSVASWTTSNATGPLLKDMNTGAWLSTASASSGLTVWVAYPQTVFNLQEQSGSKVYDTKTVSASCASGTSWNGSVCAPPAASCSATAIGSCNLSSTSSGGSSGSCVSGDVGSCSYSCSNGTWYVSSNSCAAPANCTTPWGSTVASGVSVTAFQSPSVIAPATCSSDPSQTRTCTNGTLSGSYQYQNCTVLNPTATISANPTRVQSGKTTTVTWSSTDTTSCSVTGPGLSASGTSGSQAVAVTTQSTYTVSCNGGAATATALVNVVPTFQEF